MKKFDYKAISCKYADLQETLNKYGEEGFELVTVLSGYEPTSYRLIFKK